MRTLPDEAYLALAALKDHGWLLLVQSSSSEKRLADAEAQMRANEPWTSMILEEWSHGNGNRIEADDEWLESLFKGSRDRN